MYDVIKENEKYDVSFVCFSVTPWKILNHRATGAVLSAWKRNNRNYFLIDVLAL